MRLSWSFATLLIAVPTLANVVPPRIGTVVPLTKRANLLVDGQGIVKPDALRGQLKRVTSKLARGFAAYEKNTGQRHPAQLRVIDSRETGSNSLVDEQDTLWHGTISVGTPPKEFTVDFDTGSSDLFLPGADCDKTCSGHVIYDTSASSTAKDQGRRFSLGFADGSTVQGEVFTDVVTVAGLTATNQGVGSASQYSAGLEKDQFLPDGLMGMAFPEVSELEANPFFQTLINQGTPSIPQFSFKLADSGSTLFLGGADPQLFKGNFTNVDVTQKAFWQVALDSVNVDGKPAVSRLDAVIDTGTTLIVAPQADATALYGAIPGSRNVPETLGEGVFTFPCNSNPKITLTFGGKVFAMSADSINLGPISNGSSDCVGGIIGSPGISLWVVGDIFLRNFYTKFDVGNNQVGFADLA